MNAPGDVRPIALLIGALGGEGGGVLCGWIVSAAEARGFPVQSTSIPGVAQRTGATTYYLEIWPETWSDLAGRKPVLSLTAVPGDVDVVVASELLEAGRIISQGYVTPERTCLLASTHRVFTTAEKMAMGDGRHDSQSVLAAARAQARHLSAFDMQKVAEAAGAPLSAILLGALAGTGTLPLAADEFRQAITRQGKAVEINLRGFDAGLAAAADADVDGGDDAAHQPAAADPFGDLLETAKAKLPAAVHETLGHAMPRLVIYQDARYATEYVDRLTALGDLSPDILNAVARHLAVRMTYEDVIRVAQVKLKSARMDRIRREAGAAPGEPVYVTDLFKPGVAEIADILPAAWGVRLMARAARHDRVATWNWALSLRTDRIGGALRLSVLAGLRRWRRRTYRYAREQKAIEAWLKDIAGAAEHDEALALEVARSARLIKGYGDTHSRGEGNFKSLRDAIILPALANPETPGAAASLAEAREAALADPDGRKLDEILTAVRETAD